ncbi:MAG TPA: hypothetical protein VF698_15465 [Thermoanaerobaculia bacterium]|jgi:hypothetical protein
MRSALAIVFVLAATAASALTPPPYQRVLVPLSVAELAGANGSRWTTELWAVNHSGEAAWVAPLPCIVSSASICADQIDIPAGRSVRLPPLGNASYPGVLALIPAWNAVSLTLHVRDLSKQSESWGTEIPVVRESEFFTRPTSASGIAFGRDYRHTLRLYALLDNRPSVQYRVKLYGITAAEDRLLREQVVTLVAPPAPPPNRIGTLPAQTTLTDFFNVAAPDVDRVRLTIDLVTDPLALQAPVPYWGFVSVTNNVTQQVTTVTPR